MNTAKITRKLQNKLLGPVVKQIVEEYGNELQLSPLVPNFENWKQSQMLQAQEAMTNLLINQEQTVRLEKAVALLLQKSSQDLAYQNLNSGLAKSAKVLQKQLLTQDYAWATSLSIQQWLEISDEDFLQMYTIASELFATEQVSDAADVLFFLSLLNPNVYQLWIALGMAEQQMMRYTEALRAYSFAMLINFDSPWAHLYSADVYLQMKEKDSAKAFLQLAQELNEQTQDAACSALVQQLRQSLT